MKSALQWTVASMGLVAGAAGLEHGLGEILQGNAAPAGPGPVWLIESWPGSPFFEIMAGEPAMTVIPDLLASGVLTVLAALAFIYWAVRRLDRPGGALGLLLISLLLLAVGGGFGPPLLGLILGAAALGIRREPAPPSGRLARLWRWSLAACLLAWLALCPGVNLAAYYGGVDDPNLTAAAFFVAFGLLLWTLALAAVSDLQGRAAAFAG